MVNPNMLVKFFHRGTATSDSALGYLLSEAPLKYLAGSRDRRGVVRSPPPVVLKGHTELTRQLINQSRNKQRYTSGVVSCERLISPSDEQEIIHRFERALRINHPEKLEYKSPTPAAGRHV